MDGGYRVRTDVYFQFIYIFSKTYLVKTVSTRCTESLLSLLNVHKHNMTISMQLCIIACNAHVSSGLRKSQLTASPCAWWLGPVPTESPPRLREPRRGQPLSEARSPGGGTTAHQPSPAQPTGRGIYL